MFPSPRINLCYLRGVLPMQSPPNHRALWKTPCRKLQHKSARRMNATKCNAAMSEVQLSLRDIHPSLPQRHIYLYLSSIWSCFRGWHSLGCFQPYQGRCFCVKGGGCTWAVTAPFSSSRYRARQTRRGPEGAARRVPMWPEGSFRFFRLAGRGAGVSFMYAIQETGRSKRSMSTEPR